MKKLDLPPPLAPCLKHRPRRTLPPYGSPRSVDCLPANLPDYAVLHQPVNRALMLSYQVVGQVKEPADIESVLNGMIIGHVGG